MISASSSAALPSSPDRIAGPRDLAQLHRDVWAIMRARPGIFVVLPMALWLPFDLVAEVAGHAGDDTMDQMRAMMRISNLGSLVVGTFIAGLFAATLKRMAAGQTVTLKEAVRGASEVWSRVASTWFLMGILAVLGLLAFVLPGLYLLVCWSLAVPALVFEGIGPKESLKRSRELVRGRGFFTVLGYVVAIYSVYFVVTTLPAMFVAGLVEEAGIVPLTVIVSALAGAGINVVVSAMTIGATLIYVDTSDARALSPVGPDLVADDGTRVPAPRGSGRPAFVAASVLAGVLLAGGLVAVALDVIDEETAGAGAGAPD